MKEVKSPKKPLLYYYSIVLIVILLFNWIVSPLLLRAQVAEVDYGTFMRMIEEKNIGEVEVKDSEIIFTDKDETQIYKTGAMDDPRSRSGCTNPAQNSRRMSRRPPLLF